MASPASSATHLIDVQVTDLLQRAIATVGQNVNQTLDAFAAGMTVGARGDMRKAHRAVAREVRTAVRSSYERNVEEKKRTPSYKRFNRRSGYLGAVVRRNDLVRADADGIEFLKTASFDKEAEHWRRLNFGAGSAAGEQPGPIPLRIFGQTIAALDFEIGPSAPFMLPPGFFIQGGKAVTPRAEYRGTGSIGKFIPNRKSPYRPAYTEGIKGRHFLEAGLDAIAVHLPLEYENMLNEWIQRGGRKAAAIHRVRSIRG